LSRKNPFIYDEGMSVAHQDGEKKAEIGETRLCRAVTPEVVAWRLVS
jgi:hypothetical protein